MLERNQKQSKNPLAKYSLSSSAKTRKVTKGLELLRTVNPKLETITIKSFESALEKHPSLSEDGAYEYKEECVIS